MNRILNIVHQFHAIDLHIFCGGYPTLKCMRVGSVVSLVMCIVCFWEENRWMFSLLLLAYTHHNYMEFIFKFANVPHHLLLYFSSWLTCLIGNDWTELSCRLIWNVVLQRKICNSCKRQAQIFCITLSIRLVMRISSSRFFFFFFFLLDYTKSHKSPSL